MALRRLRVSCQRRKFVSITKEGIPYEMQPKKTTMARNLPRRELLILALVHESIGCEGVCRGSCPSLDGGMEEDRRGDKAGPSL